MSGNVWVVGAGAVGSVTAAKLRSDPACRLIDAWPEHVEAMRAQGLQIDYSDATLRLSLPAFHLAEIDEIGERPDVVLLAVKSTSTEEVVRRLLPCMTDKTVVVSLQNGINEEAISGLAGTDRTIGAAVAYGGELVAPGVVRTTGRMNGTSARLVIGELDGADSPRLRGLAATLGTSVPVEVTDNIWGYLWSKLIVNVQVNALCALTGLRTDEIAADETLRRISLSLTKEATAVAFALGMRMDSLLVWGDAQAPLDMTGDQAMQVVERCFVRRWTGSPARPSMLQDVDKGRPTEIDALNGYVVAKAHPLGVSVPVNETIVRLVKDIEASGRGPQGHMEGELRRIYAAMPL